MSALDHLPRDIREQIIKADDAVSLVAPAVRPDLSLILFAERLGWKVSFERDSWMNPARFVSGNTTIWYTADGWHAATANQEDVMEPPATRRLYPPGYHGLKKALETEESP